MIEVIVVYSSPPIAALFVFHLPGGLYKIDDFIINLLQLQLRLHRHTLEAEGGDAAIDGVDRRRVEEMKREVR